MPVWSEARHAGLAARTGEQARRAAPGSTNVALPQAKERFERQVCVYCCGTTGSRVGYLAITGPVVFCKRHRKQYQDDVIWEATYKKEMGL